MSDGDPPISPAMAEWMNENVIQCCKPWDKCERHAKPLQWSDVGSIEVPPNPSGAYDFRVEDTDGNLWGLTQQLKRLDDLLSHYDLGAVLIDRPTGRRVVLAHFVTLTEDGPDGPLQRSAERPERGSEPGRSDGPQ